MALMMFVRMLVGICECINITLSVSTRLAGFAASVPNVLVFDRSTLNPLILLFTMESAIVSRSIAVAVFSMPNSGAFNVDSGITYPGGKKLNTEFARDGFSVHV